jgi:hypothetical protein
MAMAYLPCGRDIIISPTVRLSISEGIDSTFYAFGPNRPDAFFNQLAPTIQQTLQPLRAVVVTTKRLESMLKEVCNSFPINELPIASSCAYAPAPTITEGERE